MMYNYPFFTFPHFRTNSSYYSSPHTSPMFNRNGLNSSYIKANNISSTKVQDYSFENQSNKISKSNHNISSKISQDENVKKNTNRYSNLNLLNNLFNQDDRDKNESYFEIFGLKLYNDDLIIILLIFFLYKEDVKDQYLFFALILLLLT